MNCEDYQSRMTSYILGELPAGEAVACRNHLETCTQCRASYETYARLVAAIEQEPELTPTVWESEALSRALGEVAQPAKSAREALPQGLPALIWASLAAFVVVASILALQVSGCLSLVSAARSVGPAPIALAVVVTIFVTSFLPIAVAARRRPLNGMTFRR